MIQKYLFCFVLTCLFFIDAHAEIDSTSEINQNSTISALKFVGLNRTDASVVRDEISVKVGDRFNEKALLESLRRLRNTRLFSKVTYQIDPVSEDQIRLSLILEEKWTTIPIAKAGGGGGVNFFTLGVYDINAFGKNLEIGGQYERFNESDSGVIWFRKPNFLGKRIHLSADIWSIMRLRTSYDKDGNEVGGYLLDQKRTQLMLSKELNRNFEIGAGVELNQFEIESDEVEGELRDLNRENGLSFSSKVDQTSVVSSIRLGHLNWDNEVVEGQELKVLPRVIFNDSQASFQVLGEYRHFWRFSGRQNIATLVRLGKTQSDFLEDQFYIGGLENIRGFADRQFSGDSFYQANVEYRRPVYTHRLFKIQGNVFLDAGDTDFSGDPIYSSGVGFRIISDKVYRLNIRADYAFGFGRRNEQGFSFGLQQFF